MHMDATRQAVSWVGACLRHLPKDGGYCDGCGLGSTSQVATPLLALLVTSTPTWWLQPFLSKRSMLMLFLFHYREELTGCWHRCRNLHLGVSLVASECQMQHPFSHMEAPEELPMSHHSAQWNVAGCSCIFFGHTQMLIQWGRRSLKHHKALTQQKPFLLPDICSIPAIPSLLPMRRHSKGQRTKQATQQEMLSYSSHQSKLIWCIHKNRSFPSPQSLNSLLRELCLLPLLPIFERHLKIVLFRTTFN